MSFLFAVPPFSGWQARRSIDEDLPDKEVRYEFEGHGVEVICDADQRVCTIFLHRGDGEALSEISFSLGRRDVLEHYGTPSRSDAASRHEVFGEIGAWDRFDLPAVSIHVQYRVDRDEIHMITLMRPDVTP